MILGFAMQTMAAKAAVPDSVFVVKNGRIVSAYEVGKDVDNITFAKKAVLDGVKERNMSEDEKKKSLRYLKEAQKYADILNKYAEENKKQAEMVNGSIDELEKNVLYVFTYISGFRERLCVCNGKRNVQFLCKCFCKQCFSRTRRTYNKNV